MRSNIYYQPEAFGLKVLAELDEGAAYEFNMLVVWQDAEGYLWYGADAGCSCPTPFEDITTTEDLHKIADTTDLGKLRIAIMLLGNEYSMGTDNPWTDDKVAFWQRVNAAYIPAWQRAKRVKEEPDA